MRTSFSAFSIMKPATSGLVRLNFGRSPKPRNDTNASLSSPSKKNQSRWCPPFLSSDSWNMGASYQQWLGTKSQMTFIPFAWAVSNSR